ncbi:hypothetical protein BpsS140_00053 [Bacillus phage vB_BpsS-140]|nr:hypothetical protein BpsS140_00053 [Bacillus phage vB_BpsS-140]
MRITLSRLATLSAVEVVERLSNSILEDVPEGITTEDDIKKLEILLGRLPNNYAYVVELLGYSRSMVRTYKREKEKEKYENAMDLRDALENIASAIKLQYQGVSRMLTAYEQRDEENKMHEYRKERE